MGIITGLGGCKIFLADRQPCEIAFACADVIPIAVVATMKPPFSSVW